MTMTSDMLIDWALNLTGYLAAGALPVVIWSILTHRRRHPRPVPAASEELQAKPAVAPSTRRADPRACQFVSLAPQAGPETEQSLGDDRGPGRQDRSDVIRLARQMLRAGASHQRIQQVLPVSAAELALLSYHSGR